MKRIFIILVTLSLFAFSGCSSDKPPHGDFDYMSSEQSSNSNLTSSGPNSEDVKQVANSGAKDTVADSLSEQGKKVYDIIKIKFDNVKVIESHKKSDPTDIGLTALITIENVSENTPNDYIAIAKEAFISGKISKSKYSNIGFSISTAKEGLATLIILKDKKSSEWTSDIVATSGNYKSNFELAYNKSAFFSDFDLMKQSEKSFDEIAKEYNLE